MTNIFLYNLHQFFSDSSKHQLQKKVVFAPGTAPMRKDNSEVEDILFATDFDSAYFVDPVYGVDGKDSPLEWDLEAIKVLDSRADVILACPESLLSDPGRASPGTALYLASLARMTRVNFSFDGSQREITFIPGDATLPQFQPQDFTIFFSGKRIGMYPGFGLRGTPSDYLHEIVRILPVGGYVIPDRDLLDDSVYFLLPLHELGLEEVPGIRVPISRSDFPKGYSEGKRFVHTEFASGVGLYKKFREGKE